MADNYSIFNPTVDLNPYSNQIADIQRRQRMAQLLQQQGMEPLESQVVGGQVIRTSPWQVLAKALQTGLGAYQGSQADKAAADLREQMAYDQRQKEAEVASVGQAMMGRLTGERPTKPTPAPGAANFDELGYEETAPTGPRPIQLGANATFAPRSIEEASKRTAESNQLGEITPTVKYQYDPNAALQMAMTPTGTEAMKANPLLASLMAQTLKNKFEPKSVEKSIDLGNKTRVFYSDGTTEDIAKGAAPAEPMTPYQAASLAQEKLLRERELGIREREANLKTVGTPQQQQKLKASKAEDISNYQSVIDTKNELNTLKDKLFGNKEMGIAPHPGLSGITGAQAYFPNMPATSIGGVQIASGNAKAAQQILDTFKGKIASLGRQLQSTNGKLGNMAVQEWKIVSDAVQKIDPSAPNFEEQLSNAVSDADALAARINGRYENEYGESMPRYEGHTQSKSSYGIGYDKNQNIFDKADAIIGK